MRECVVVVMMVVWGIDGVGTGTNGVSTPAAARQINAREIRRKKRK
jgi:hypothetical protein